MIAKYCGEPSNKVISHRITADEVVNVDYAKDTTGNDILLVSYKNGSITIGFTPSDFTTFKNDIATTNQYLMIPTNSYTKSTTPSLNSDVSFVLIPEDLQGSVEVSLESTTNAPYLLIRTYTVRRYQRLIQIYLSPEDVDKLDEITVRNESFIYSPSNIATINCTQPTLLFTTNTGKFISIDVPAASVAGLKAESSAEEAFQADPLNTQSVISVSEINAISRDVDQDTITSISIGHTTTTNVSFLQFTQEETQFNRLSVYTIYMYSDVFSDFNTQIQSWS